MTVTIVLGAPASGKTAWLINRIQTIKKENRFAPVWILVHNRSKASYLRKRIAWSGGAVGVIVGTFTTFCQEILERNGQFLPIMPAAMESRVIQEVLAEANQTGALKVFGSIQNKPGLISVLSEAFTDLQGGLIEPEEILDSAVSNPIEREIGGLYCLFLNKAGEHDWIHPEQLNLKASDALVNAPALARDIRLVAVDGFTAFSAARRRLLKQLAEQVGELVITLPGKRDPQRELDRGMLQQLELLQSDLGAELIEVAEKKYLPPTLQKIKETIFEKHEQQVQFMDEAMLVEAAAPSEEAREALRWLKRKHLREGVPLDEMAIYVSNLDLYRPWLNMIGREFGMPLYYFARERLAATPAVDAILRFLRLPLEGFLSRAILNLFASPYLNFGFSSAQILELDQIAIQQIVVSGRDQWDQAWTALRKRSVQPEAILNEDLASLAETDQLDLESLISGFEQFWNLFEDIQQARDLSAWLGWLEDGLEKLGFHLNLETQDDFNADQKLRELFQSLLITEKVLGSRRVDYAGFLEILRASIQAAQINPAENDPRSAIFVDQINSAHTNRHECVAILGLSEGSFPIPENSDPFLSETFREEFGLEPRLGRHQQNVFYQAITRANKSLLITRSYLNESGEPSEPSAYWQAIKDLIPPEGVKRILPGQIFHQSEAGSLSEMLVWAARQNLLVYSQLAEPSDRWSKLQMARVVLNARRAAAPEGMFEGKIEVDPKDLARDLWSASSLETFASCPFHYFCAYVLGLEERELPELGFDSAQLGSIYHKVLEKVYREVLNSGVHPGEILEEIALSIFDDAPEKQGFRPSLLWQIEKEQMLELLKRNIVALEEQREIWQPYKLEYVFGRQWVPALTIDTKDGEILRFRGFIDRVDVDKFGNFRVIDYKTSSASISKRDLERGTRLQLPLYAKSFAESLGQGEVVDGFYWSLGTQKPSSLQLGQYGVEAAWQTAKEHILTYYEQIRSGAFQPIQPKGGCPDYCPAVGWCWRFEKRSSF